MSGCCKEKTEMIQSVSAHIVRTAVMPLNNRHKAIIENPYHLPFLMDLPPVDRKSIVMVLIDDHLYEVSVQKNQMVKASTTIMIYNRNHDWSPNDVHGKELVSFWYVVPGVVKKMKLTVSNYR